MKIRKFNEDLDVDNIDLEYIDECFIDIIDRLEYSKDVYRKDSIVINIGIPDKYTIPFFSGSAENMIMILEWKSNLISDIRYALDKIKIKYSDLAYSIEFDEHSNMDEGRGYVNVNLSNKSEWNEKI